MKAFMLGVLFAAVLDYAGVMNAASIIVLIQALGQVVLAWLLQI